MGQCVQRSAELLHPDEIKVSPGIDPLFAGNLQDYDSLGKRCAAGEDVFYVQGSGHVKGVTRIDGSLVTSIVMACRRWLKNGPAA